MVKFFVKSIIIISFLGSSAFAQAISIDASTDSSEYIIGDYINYRLEISYDKGIQVAIPSVKDSIPNLDFVKEKPPLKQESGDRIVEIHEYVFSKYDSSSVTIPSFGINYKTADGAEIKSIKTNPVFLTIRILEVDKAGDIQDVKAPLKIPFNLLILLIIILAVLALLTAAYFVYRYYQKKKLGGLTEEIIVKVPPHKIALKALYELKEKKLWQQGKVKDYHSEITGIIRRYFEVRFNFLALEMPSSEVLNNLSHIKKSDIIYNITRDFLNNADLVKFAKFQPLPSVNEEMMKQAFEVVNKTKPLEVEEEKEKAAHVE